MSLRRPAGPCPLAVRPHRHRRQRKGFPSPSKQNVMRPVPDRRAERAGGKPPGVLAAAHKARTPSIARRACGCAVAGGRTSPVHGDGQRGASSGANTCARHPRTAARAADTAAAVTREGYGIACRCPRFPASRGRARSRRGRHPAAASAERAPSSPPALLPDSRQHHRKAGGVLFRACQTPSRPKPMTQRCSGPEDKASGPLHLSAHGHGHASALSGRTGKNIRRARQQVRQQGRHLPRRPLTKVLGRERGQGREGEPFFKTVSLAPA